MECSVYDLNGNMESDSNGGSGGCSISFNEKGDLNLLTEPHEKHYVPNNTVMFGHRGSSGVVPLGPLNYRSTGNITKTNKIDGNNKLDILSYSGDYSTLSQLNQDMLGRRHSVDSNIGRTRQPTFVRTYREVKWKRVNKPTKFPPIPSPLTSGKLGAADCNENVAESREYITGTNIIRQRVPIFKTNGDPPSMAGRRFSAGDLIPVTGLDLNMAPNRKCLVIWDILPNNLMSNSNSDDSSSSRKGSTSSSEDITSSPPNENRRASNNTDSLYEFCLIDEDDEDEEITDDGTDEDDEEGQRDKMLMFKNTAIEYIPRTGVNSSAVLYSFSAPDPMSSPLTMANGSTGHDLRRLVLKNSMQMKTAKAQPDLKHSTGTLVSESPAVGQAREVMKSAMFQQSLVPFSMSEVMSVTMESAAKSAPTEANGIPLTTKPVSVCILDHCVQVPSLNETVMSPSVTQTVLMTDKKTLHAESHNHSFHADASEVKLHPAPVPSVYITGQPVAGETSWVLTSTKIAGANVYVSCFHPPNSKVRVRRAHWVSPQFVKGMIPIDMEGAKAISVELVAVPTTSSDEPLMFQRVTYSSGYIYRSAHWAAPSKSQIAHTVYSCKNNSLTVSGHLHTTSIPHVSLGEKTINNCSVDKVDEMQKGICFLDHPLRIHPLSVNSDKKVGVQTDGSVCCRNDYISPIPMAGHSFCKEPNWKCAERNLFNGVNSKGQYSCISSGVLSPSIPLISTSMTLQRPLMSTNVFTSHLSTLKCDGKPLHLTSNNISSTSISEDEKHPMTIARLSTMSRDHDCKPAPSLTEGLQILSRCTLGKGSSCGIFTNSSALHTEQTKLTMTAADSCQSSSLAGRDHVATKLSETVGSCVSSNRSEDYNCLHSDTTDTQPSFDIANQAPHVSTGKIPLLSHDRTVVLRPGQASSQHLCASDLFLSEDNSTRLTDMNTGIKTQARSCIDSNGLIQSILSSLSDNEKKAGLLNFKRGGSSVAIDNKIEQAMDLVKRHLMYAVREEVEILKQQIGEMMERIGQLEYENTILRSEAKPETLNKLQQPRASQTSQTVLPGQNSSIMSVPNLQQPQQTTSMPAAQSQPSQQAVQSLSQQQVPQTQLFQSGQSPL